MTSYSALAPSTNIVGTAVKVNAIPVALFTPIEYIGLLFLTRPLPSIKTTGAMSVPLIISPGAGICLISFIAWLPILVVVLIISDGNDMKLPTGNTLAVLTISPTKL